MTLRLALALVVMAFAGCTSGRSPASLTKQLAPAAPTNTGYADGDEPPVILTPQGYEVSDIPGVAVPTPAPFKYITYVGPSN